MFFKYAQPNEEEIIDERLSQETSVIAGGLASHDPSAYYKGGRCYRATAPSKTAVRVHDVGQVMVVVITIGLMLFALTLVTIGTFFASNEKAHRVLPWDVENDLQETVEKLGTKVNMDKLSFRPIFRPLAIGLIVCGLVIGTMALLGCAGVFSDSRVILFVFLALSIGLLLTYVILSILLICDRSFLARQLTPQMRDTIREYAGIQGTNPQTLSWNALMIHERCCGLENYTDFHNGLRKWPAPINGESYPLITPLVCCRDKTLNYSCAEDPKDSNSYWKIGCEFKYFNIFLENPVTQVLIVFILVAQVALILFTLFILFV